MIVIRYTWHFQDSSLTKANKVIMEVKMPETNLLRTARAYESVTGTGNGLAVEWEFDSLSDWEMFLPLFIELPGNAELLTNMPDAISQTTEVWRKVKEI